MTIIISVIAAETISCAGVGIQAVVDRCNKFVNCYNGVGVIQSCSPGTVFHKVSVYILWCLTIFLSGSKNLRSQLAM